MNDIPETFGSAVFNDEKMRERLPKEIYDSLKKTAESGARLEPSIADVVAEKMKEWACEMGATHFTHWFQPMTGITAEKHDSFITPVKGSDKVIMEFRGKELSYGEPDASSLPNGGLRATFEARGYTAWDPSSYAFVKDGTLFIPSVFISYSGEALDKKTPLLRSIQALGKQVSRILALFGGASGKTAIPTVGAEQEYFLIDKEVYLKRPDLVTCGRTLFGAPPAKGQELHDHYFGAIKPRVMAFMADLDRELWKLGVLAKTKHNEAAPSQHELAPLFTGANVATDHNQLTMSVMRAIAEKHGLVCLLHEKPFKGVNGSGKHNNWSLLSDTGVNLLSPGETPAENAQFLLFLTAIIKAVDDHQDLMRMSVATASNDHRLGANEAPPAIISISLGEELTELLSALEQNATYHGKEKVQIEIGADVLPKIPKDTTDRNRTSPFAFTGNKFEFRMPGSSLSVSGPNIILNTIVAEALDDFATKLERSENFTSDLNKLIRETIVLHKRIIFNGDGYSKSWEEEAEKRGLLNLKTTADALPSFIKEKSRKLFEKYGVFTEAEIYSRYQILLESYSTTVDIEALTVIDMVKRNILPAAEAYQSELCDIILKKKDILGEESVRTEKATLEMTSSLAENLTGLLGDLESKVAYSKGLAGLPQAIYTKEEVLPAMNEMREIIDSLERIVDAAYWRFPTYNDLLYSVN